jgi:hypothetical protein
LLANQLDRLSVIVKAASVSGLCYAALTAAFGARRRIDLAAAPHRLRYHGIASAIACRTFMLIRLRGWLFHLNLLVRSGWRSLSYSRRRPFLIIVPAVTASRTKPTTHVAYAAAVLG